MGNTSSIRVNFQPAVSVDKRVIAGNCYCSSDFIPWIDFLLPRDGGEQTKGVIHRVAPLHEFCLQLKRLMSQLPWFITSLTFKKNKPPFWKLSSWWFQPLWKIIKLDSSSPQLGVKITKKKWVVTTQVEAFSTSQLQQKIHGKSLVALTHTIHV